MAKFEVGDQVVIRADVVVPGYPNEPATIIEVREHCDRQRHEGRACEGVFLFRYADGTIPGFWTHLDSRIKVDR